MSDSDLYGDSVYEGGEAVEDTDDLDPIEALTGDDPDEAMQTGYNPPDREPYNLSHIPTPFEEAQGESLDQKLSEEEPEVSEEDVFAGDADPRAGRLVAPDEGAHADEEKDEIAADVGPAGYASSAEEAAVHVIDEDATE
ncbi:DUF5709 domain-containing protein [uncultured Jatrophihabitans sp.]|uniref:DUF5709 domain-containing protein n=1 Tax=uncultured Jatrophihabitans sp. TaxID=1610747 RepID=UPI0035C9FA13